MVTNASLGLRWLFSPPPEVFLLACLLACLLCWVFIAAQAVSGCVERGLSNRHVRASCSGPFSWGAGSELQGGLPALKRRLRRRGARAWLLQSMWDLPGPGVRPVSLALAGIGRWIFYH